MIETLRRETLVRPDMRLNRTVDMGEKEVRLGPQFGPKGRREVFYFRGTW